MLIYLSVLFYSFSFFFNDPATTEIYTLSLHDALPISHAEGHRHQPPGRNQDCEPTAGRRQPDRARVHSRSARSEEHTSELQSRRDLVCRLLLEKKKKKTKNASKKKTKNSIMPHERTTV